MNLGYIISKLREGRGWSQDELAYHAATTAASISRIENNKQDATSDLIGKIARAFELHAYQLIALAEGLEIEGIQTLEVSEERKLLENYRRLSRQQRATLAQLTEWLAAKAQDEEAR